MGVWGRRDCRQGGVGARLVLLERVVHALQRLARRARLHLLRLACLPHLLLHHTAHRRHLGGRLLSGHRLPPYRLFLVRVRARARVRARVRVRVRVRAS